MMGKQNITSSIFTSLLYICGLILFLEWLYPINVFDEMSNINVFIIYTLFCFFISLLNVRWWLSVLLKGSSLLFMINKLFFHEPIISKVWIEKLYTEILLNMDLLFQQNWYDLTTLFRSLLLLLLIWLMSYLVHYWFFVTKRIFLFIVLTFIYITILDTFTIYDGTFAIIRVFIISFLSLGVTNFLRKLMKESIQISSFKKSLAWMIPIAMTVLLTSIIGYISPKYAPQWPDPIPFIKSMADHESYEGEIRKVGYGSDDSRLGGSFITDDTPVFQVVTMKKHYWRVETKDIYTGKGWDRSKNMDYLPLNYGVIPSQTHSGIVEVESLEALVEYESNTNMDKLVYPYGLRRIESFSFDQKELVMDYHSESIQKQTNKALGSAVFRLEYFNPLYDLEMLQEANEENLSMQIQYTQVPEKLPERVYNLAEEITAPFESRYDQVKAIEQYFNENGFHYQTTDVPFPAEDQDYVDQFLFDTKIGYCDNYSTSMVVMLRTLNIPARWVKGFTGGQQINQPSESSIEGYNYYEVTNANAHSWVEVYFSDIGWVPFEPTQGFSNEIEFYEPMNELEEEENDQTSEEDEFEVDEPDDLPISEEAEDAKEEEDDTVESGNKLQIHWVYFIIGFLIFFCMIYVIYKSRFKLKTFYLSKELQKNNDYITFEKAYQHLLNILNEKGIIKRPDQTLREYAKYIDERFDTNEMGILTKHYEKMLYNNEINRKVIKSQGELWKSLIKQITD